MHKRYLVFKCLIVYLGKILHVLCSFLKEHCFYSSLFFFIGARQNGLLRLNLIFNKTEKSIRFEKRYKVYFIHFHLERGGLNFKQGRYVLVNKPILK